MRITCLSQKGFLSMFGKACQTLGFDTSLYSVQDVEERPEKMSEALRSMEGSDLVFLYPSGETFWAGAEPRLKEIGKRVPIACLSHGQSPLSFSTASPEVMATASLYLTYHGEKNLVNMFRYLCREMAGKDIECEPPEFLAWDGVYHPDAPSHFESVAGYLDWYRPDDRPTVGLILLRFYWVNRSMEVENALIRALESRGLNVIPVFSYSIRDEGLGSRGMADVIEDYFVRDGRPLVDAVIKTVPFLIGKDQYVNVSDHENANLKGIDVLKRLGVPVFQPIVSHYKTQEEWEASEGLATDIGWSVSMPEFEGVIEPILIGAGSGSGNFIDRKPIEERCDKLAKRVEKWISLARKPVRERRVAFVLMNNPCAGVEATVGAAGGLDSLESLSLIMKRMKAVGYTVDAPESGKALIDEIMRKKAIAEFRWTGVESIVKSGGAVAQVSTEDYLKWFDTLSPKVKESVINAWGRPPGEQVGQMPPARVYEGRIVITGLKYGNAVVCVQPKRGCAGARCDGQVCKILQDPDVPPTHQFMATYRWLEDGFGADVLVHVGAHGSLEFLPGKNVGLSKDCFPDITIGTIPHLYIYNPEASPDAMAAKRRSYATLVDHLQPVPTIGGLYGELEEVNRLLCEHETAKFDRARAHALRELLVEAVKAAKLDRDVRLRDDMPLEELVPAAHEALSRIRNTQISTGMHVFGRLPDGEKRVDFVNSVLRYESGGVSLRGTIAGMMGLKLKDLLGDQGAVDERYHRSHGQLLEEIDGHSKALIRAILQGERSPDKLSGLPADGFEADLETIRERVIDISLRIDESLEIESLLNGMDGGYVPAGPSGLIARGRDDVLPTGRNFYSLDPFRVPTKAAWKVGQGLAASVLEKHLKEEGRHPENIAFYWLCSDIMWADGEDMAQIMCLLGVEPVWQPNGRLKGFQVVPPEKLGRPRIDVTIRVSSLTRDNFSNCIDVIDEAIQAAASLDEPPGVNFVRKHALASIDAGLSNDMRDATLRIFSSRPGSHSAGVDYAVLASSWKERKDLSDIFVLCNGYAYGKGVHGKEAHQQLVNSLKTVEITYNKVVSDEHDLTGGCYYAVHGGMTAAAREVSGRTVRAYYGDTREPEHVEVRDLADEIRRVARAKLFNPKWIEGMKEHGYKGAADIMGRVDNVYGWEASTGEVDDRVFDDIAKTFVLDEENRRFFEEHNPYALEEITRRLLEANQRELWDADPDVLEKLKEARLEIEGWLEERAGDGEFQGGAIDVYTAAEIDGWGDKMKTVMEKIRK